MSELIRRVSREMPEKCQVKSCSKEGCSLTLKGIGKTRVIVDMDCGQLDLSQDQTRCDYVFVGSHTKTDWVVPIELKRGGVEASEVSSQVQAGAKFAESKLLIDGENVRFRPVVAYGRVHRSQIEELKRQKYRIRFRNERYEIMLIRKNKPLADALR